MIKKAILFGLFAVVTYFIGSTIITLGFLSHYYKHHPGTCRVVETNGFGSEDLDVTSQGLAFITSGVSWSSVPPDFVEFLEKNNVKGRVLLYDLKNPQKTATELKLKPSNSFNPETFRPHGLSILEDKTKGEHLIYVINHRPETDAIEKFRFNPKTNELIHLKSFEGEMVKITNDLAVLAEDQFYISNWLSFRDRLMATVETLFHLPLGSILFYNGTGFTTAVSSLSGPNSVFLSKDNRFLYLALPGQHAIRVFERKADNSLVPFQTVPINTGVDNLALSQDGKSLYAGCHPIIYKVAGHMEDPNMLAPSQVLKFPLKNGKIQKDEATELFYDHGKLISASTVGVVYNNSLLIGSLMNKLVICEGVNDN